MDPLGDVLLKILLLVALIALNAFFAMSEIAIISLNDNKIKKMAEEGNKKAQKLLKFIKEPSNFLAMIQVGVTLSGLMASAVAAESFVGYFVRLFNFANIAESVLRPVILVVLTLVLAYFTLVFGELIPKRVAMQNSEKLSFSVVGFLSVLGKFIKPFVSFLAFSTNSVLRLLKIDPDSQPDEVTEEEIRMLVDVGEEKGFIEESQKEMINNIFEFDDITVGEIMTHRTEISAVEKDDDLSDIIEIATTQGYSRIPVYDEDLDNIIGVIYVKDLLSLVGKNLSKLPDVKSFIRPVLYFPESAKAKEVFGKLVSAKMHLSIVVDEYGGTAGLITLEDLIETIVGNIQDEYDDENEEISKITEREFVMDGTADIEEMAELLNLTLPDDFEDETAAGFVLHIIGRIPEKEEKVEFMYQNVKFSVEGMDEKRIAKIKAIIPEKEEG